MKYSLSIKFQTHFCYYQVFKSSLFKSNFWCILKNTSHNTFQGNLVQFINTNLRKLIDVSNDSFVTTELNQFLDYLFTFSQKELFANTLQQVIYTKQDTVRNFRVEIERGSGMLF